jgi:hypothetical protein
MHLYPRSVGAALIVTSLSITAAVAEPFRLEKTFDLASGDRFVLASEIGGVVVRGVAGRQANIVVTSDRQDLADRYDIRFEHAGGRLRMVAERRNKSIFGGWFQSFRGNVRITVDVPRATPVEVNTSGGSIDVSLLDASVKASSSGGGVKVADVRGPVHLESSGGGVRAAGIDGPVHADSSGGSVTLEAVSGDIQAGSSGGGVDIRAAGGRVKAGSSGGPVRVAFAPGNAKGGDVDSSGGGVSVTVDAGAGIDLDASSSGGSVVCDLPVTIQGKVSRDSLHGKLNGGGALLRLRSSGGGITIR